MNPKTPSSLFLLTAVILVMFAVLAYAGDKSQCIGFADYLFSQEEYYRAVGEYKRYIFLYPADTRAVYAQFKIGLSFFHAHQYHNAHDAFQSIHTVYEHTSLRRKQIAALWQARACLYTGSFTEAQTLYTAIINNPASPALYNLAQYHTAWRFIMMRDWKSAKNAFTALGGVFNNADTNSLIRRAAVDIPHYITEQSLMKKKSPTAAGIASALIPGLSQMLGKRIGDGLAAFFTVGILTSVTWYFFENDMNTYGYITGGMSLFFHAGNIYMATSGTKLWNKNRDQYHRDILIKRYWTDAYIE